MTMNMDNAVVFNNKEAVEDLVESLSDRKLKPFPHIGVIGPNPHRENTSSIFTDSTQIPPYVVGYKVEVKSDDKDLGESKSVFGFTVRNSLSDFDAAFEEFRISVLTNLGGISTKCIVENLSSGEECEVALTRREAGKRVSFEGVFVQQYIFIYEKSGEKKETPWNLHIHIKKSVKKNADTYDIETKFVNESSAESITGDAIELEADDEIPNEYVKTGYLMNIYLNEQLIDAQFNNNEKKTPIRRLFNVVPDKELKSKNELYFRDYFIGYEKILKLKPSDKTIDDFIMGYNNGKAATQKLSPVIGKVFKSVFKSPKARFHKYQEEGITQIWDEICNRQGRVKVISVRTAGGKTETFMVPVIQYCINNLEKIGTKALIFYPTKALANDQAKRIFKALYYTNKELISEGQRQITMALYHGDIEKHSRDEINWVPFKCVKDDCNTQLVVQSDGIINVLNCPACAERYDYVYVTRDESHRKLPDILITNPDTLTWVLSKNGEKQSILGRKIKYCSSCGYPNKNVRARKCVRYDCSGSLIEVNPDCVPELVIFDEVHLFGGAFGISVSQFLKRLNGAIKSYHVRINGNSKFKPVYVASTATIKDPRDFSSKFFNFEKDYVDMIPSSNDPSTTYEDISKSEISRYNLFILPRAYLAKQTTALAAKFLLDHAKNMGGDFKPRILGFANSLRDCNDLIAETRARYDGSYNIDGHNTQYDNEERSEREVLFNKGDVSVLYATSTLEVGVDFEAMHALIIFGPPYSFNDYLQRIGRAGRNSDAVVITVIKMNNPVDYYYYENCYELVSNPMNNTERVPISSYNPHVEKKQVISTFFDYIQLQDNAHEYDDYKFFNTSFFTGAYWKPTEIKLVKKYIKGVFEIEEDRLEEILEELKDQIFAQADETPKKTLGDIFNHVLEQTEFTNLRSSDPVVEVEYIFGEA